MHRNHAADHGHDLILPIVSIMPKKVVRKSAFAQKMGQQRQFAFNSTIPPHPIGVIARSGKEL